MRKFKLFLDARKEEKWLNQMLQKGWVLKSANTLCGLYTFEATANLSQIIRLDCQSFPSREKFQDYQTLYEEFGWIHISGTRFSTLQYWLNPSNQTDALFSDEASNTNYLQRLTTFYGSLAFFCLMMMFITFDNIKQFFNLKSAFYTPGIWEMEGLEFATALLIESPFALIRFGSPYLTLIFLIITFNAYYKYKTEVEKLN